MLDVTVDITNLGDQIFFVDNRLIVTGILNGVVGETSDCLIAIVWIDCEDVLGEQVTLKVRCGCSVEGLVSKNRLFSSKSYNTLCVVN